MNLSDDNVANDKLKSPLKDSPVYSLVQKFAVNSSWNAANMLRRE